MAKVLTISNKRDTKMLRRQVADFNFKKFKKTEIRELIKEMRQTMEQADGIGLAANQIGLDIRVFIARAENKFYAIFNPEIVKSSKEAAVAEEGCLSVPHLSGRVIRPSRITLKGFDKNGKRVTIKAWGHLARVFQHEVDHLNGVLFTDYIKK